MEYQVKAAAVFQLHLSWPEEFLLKILLSLCPEQNSRILLTLQQRVFAEAHRFET